MPFCDTEHGPAGSRKTITQFQWAHIFEYWIKKAVVESYKPGDLFVSDGDLASAVVVVADLTGARPNVYYELGIRHGLKIGTIIITQDIGALPSDLSSYFVFAYEYSEKAHEYEEYFQRFEKRMHETLKAWEEADDPSDSPVSDFLGIKDQILEREMVIEKEKLKILLVELKSQLVHNLKACNEMLRGVKGAFPEFDGLLMIDGFS